ncbi:MAG: winged helix-turn-helix domain-containing protein [Jiangellaceae bacterium]
MTTRRSPNLIISPRVGHGAPTTGSWTSGNRPAVSTSAAMSEASTWSSMNSVTTSSGLAAIQPRSWPSISRKDVEPVSQRPWHRRRASAPSAAPATDQRRERDDGQRHRARHRRALRRTLRPDARLGARTGASAHIQVSASPDLLAWLLLYPDHELGLTELAQRLDVPLTTLHREAQRLIEAGLLQTRTHGRSRLVRAHAPAGARPGGLDD